MSVSKGFTRPETWPPVGSIVQIAQQITLHRSVVADEGEWVVIRLTTGTLITNDGRKLPIRLALLHDRHGAELYRVFRRGRRDYSDAWHATPAWMEQT